MVDEYLKEKRKEYARQLEYAWLGGNNKDNSDYLRGCIQMLDMILNMKLTFEKAEKLEKDMEEAEKEIKKTEAGKRS